MANIRAPYLSVVMPVYNRANLVRHAVQSILDQTYEDWELIIVDDGSNDDTGSVVRAFKDERIRVFTNKHNRGVSYSRNRGNGKARGEVIVVQDSDDMSLPDRLEWVADTFKKYPDIDVLYHHFYIRAVDIRYGQRAIHREIHRCGKYDKKRAITEPYIPGQLAYRKQVANECPYRLEMKNWDDWAFIIDCTMKDKTFVQLERPLYEYVITDDSLTTVSDHDGSRELDREQLKRILKRDYDIDAR